MDSIQNLLSAIAIGISLISLGISLYMSRAEERPYICLKKIRFNKIDFKIIPCSEKLPGSVVDIIESTRDRISVQKIMGKEYLLVNLIGDYDLSQCSLVLSPMECVYVSRGGHINEVILKKAEMAFRRNPKHKNKQRLRRGEKIVFFDKDKVIIRIAYVHQGNRPPSIDYMKLQKESGSFDYLMDIDKAREYINFQYEKFVFLFKNYKGKKYRRTIYLKMDNVKGLTFEMR